MGNGVDLRMLANNGGSVVISDYGAHLLRWAPAGQADVVWTPSTWHIEAGKSLGGGVPICFPWFGPGFAHGKQLALNPSHGFARLRRWALDEGSFDDSHIRYVLDSQQLNDNEVPWFDDEPGAQFHAVYDVQTGNALTMSLTVTNTGTAPMSYEAALHSYLHVGDVSGAQLVGLQGATYLDAIEEGFPPKTQDAQVVTFGEQPVNRVYYSDARLELRDDMLGRAIHISRTGSPQTVVWNPGADGDNMSYTKPGEWRGFVAVEAAVCRDRIVTLGPGESHVISQTLSVGSL